MTTGENPLIMLSLEQYARELNVNLYNGPVFCGGDYLAPTVELTHWICRGCGRTNRSDQLQCGAGDWDGCGGGRAEYAIREPIKLKKRVENSIEWFDWNIDSCVAYDDYLSSERIAEIISGYRHGLR